MNTYFTFLLLFLDCTSRSACNGIIRQLVGNDTKAVCELDVACNGTVSDGEELTYHFNISALKRDSTVRITVNSSTASVDTPLLLVARMRRGVSSWTVPFTTVEKSTYNLVSRTLCSALSQGDGQHDEGFYLDVSTSNKDKLDFTFTAFTENEFIMSVGTSQTVNVNPAEPMFFRYTFQSNQERVLIKAESQSKTCAVLMVQNTKCPSVSQNKGEYSGVFATMTKKAGITVERSRIQGDKFYIVVLVKDSDKDCEYQSGRINPFAPANGNHDDNKNKFTKTKSEGSLIIGNDRVKEVIITVVNLPRIDEYVGPVAVPLIFFGTFYLIAFIVLVVSWCMADDGGKSFYNYLFPKKVNPKEPDMNDEQERSQLLHTPTRSRSNGTYGTGVTSEMPAVNRNSEELNEDDYDYLDDIDHSKDVYRLKPNLVITDVSKKPYKKLAKKFNVYYWNLLTVSVFYALPVMQLVLTYQRVVNTSGDQDICYYNFFCARPYHLVSAFNNIYSNIGYMMLGLLFVFLVMRRDRLSKQMYVKDSGREKTFGLPGHYGLMYAMGYALFMEGIMSACYHVCPNYSNFQFDTAFMYIIGILACLRLYQTRHHDVFLNGHYAFAGFAAVIFTSVIGVIFRSWQFWVIFLLLHVVTCFYISCQIYYMGRVKTAFKVHWLASQWRLWCSKPIYKVRFVLLFIFNIVNWGLSINGLVNIPKDFATYLLGIIICNGLLYVVFYVIMKLRNGEKIQLLPFVCVLLSLITWGVSIHFFVQGLTDWQTSPAQSREGNADCKLVGFYDDHDLWHFLSATALFFSFVAILTIDDDLVNKERDMISVF